MKNRFISAMRRSVSSKIFTTCKTTFCTLQLQPRIIKYLKRRPVIGAECHFKFRRMSPRALQLHGRSFRGDLFSYLSVVSTVPEDVSVRRVSSYRSSQHLPWPGDRYRNPIMFVHVFRSSRLGLYIDIVGHSTVRCFTYLYCVLVHTVWKLKNREIIFGFKIDIILRCFRIIIGTRLFLKS